MAAKSSIPAALALGCALLAARPARADCAAGSKTKVLGLPVWSTSPNEGNTWGAMPILLHVCETGNTEWILAPSVTWNSVIHYSGTVRWYVYPDPDTTVVVFASASTHINYLAFATLQRVPHAVGRWTDEAELHLERDAFARFYGIGDDTPASAQSSYTARRAFARERRGLNLMKDFNLGLTLEIDHDGVDDTGVPGLPLSPEQFPDAPGMRASSTLLSEGLDVRYDDRVGGDYADRGIRLDAWGTVVEGLSGSPSFLRGGVQANAIVPELSRLSGAARFYWNAVSSADAPFYDQSMLGGQDLMRGFIEGRFVDRQAWTLELEQRVRVLRTHLFGVTADWRVDPFVATGQVFHSFDGALSHPRLAAGVGLRAFVHPRLVGRIDLADGGEGLSVYVAIGYPY